MSTRQDILARVATVAGSLGHAGDRFAFRGAFKLHEVEVDVAMSPVDSTNPWYPITLATSEPHQTGLRLATPLCLVATKTVAYRQRGAQDPLLSRDLEDIVAILLSHPDLITTELEVQESRLARQTARELVAIAEGPAGRELFEAHAGHDEVSRSLGHDLWVRVLDLQP